LAETFNDLNDKCSRPYGGPAAPYGGSGRTAVAGHRERHGHEECTTHVTLDLNQQNEKGAGLESGPFIDRHIGVQRSIGDLKKNSNELQIER
jgi:hypothetical protein